MIIFIHGTDSYRVKNRLDEMVASLANAKMALTYFDLYERESLNKLINTVKTLGLFATKEALVVSNAFGAHSAKFADVIQDFKLADDTERYLIVTETATETSLKKADAELHKFLTSKKCKSEVVNPLTDAQLITWMGIEGKRLGLTLEPTVVRKLLSFVAGTSPTYGKSGSDITKDQTWRLHNEIIKLAHYKHISGDKKVSAQDIELLVNPALGVNIFELTDSIAARNNRHAAKLLNQALQSGTDPFYVYSMILYLFRNLLTVKSMMKSAIALPAIITATKLHPFVAQKTASAARRFELDELKRFFTKLADLEIAAKSGTIDITDGLFQFILAI